MLVKKQQLELDMKQRTGCKLGKEYVKEGPHGRAGVQSRVGESFTRSASCSGGPWAPFLVWSRPFELPVARTRRTAGPWGDLCPPGPVCLSTRQGGQRLLEVLAAHCPGQRA